MKFLKKKKESKAHKQEFYPCNKSNCRFYGEWVLGWDEENAGIFLPIDGIKKSPMGQASYMTKLAICLSCIHFKKHSNWIIIN